MIAPINTNNNGDEHFIKTKTDIPSNFSKLGKHIMISGGSWVFNKKEKGSNDVYGKFRLKSQIPTEDMISCVSFEFSRVGGKNLFKKQHQAMEIETPVMLLFICNGTDHSSILSDTRQTLNVKRYLINHLISTMLSGQCFVFLFCQLTEQPHQGDDMNNPTSTSRRQPNMFLIHKK